MSGLRVDSAFLDDAGLGPLEETKKRRLLVYIEATLYERVGLRFAAGATREQLEQLQGLDDEAKLEWIERTFPDADAIIQDELVQLKAELSEMAADVLAAGQDHPADN